MNILVPILFLRNHVGWPAILKNQKKKIWRMFRNPYTIWLKQNEISIQQQYQTTTERILEENKVLAFGIIKAKNRID
jgi:hypothetical protein